MSVRASICIEYIFKGNVLNAALPPGAHQLANVETVPEGYTGNMLEFFQGTNESMNKLLALKGTFVEVHATSRGANFQLSLAVRCVLHPHALCFSCHLADAAAGQ